MIFRILLLAAAASAASTAAAKQDEPFDWINWWKWVGFPFIYIFRGGGIIVLVSIMAIVLRTGKPLPMGFG